MNLIVLAGNTLEGITATQKVLMTIKDGQIVCDKRGTADEAGSIKKVLPDSDSTGKG